MDMDSWRPIVTSKQLFSEFERNGRSWKNIDWESKCPNERGSRSEIKIQSSHLCHKLVDVESRESRAGLAGSSSSVVTHHHPDVVHLICTDGAIPVQRAFIHNVLRLRPPEPTPREESFQLIQVLRDVLDASPEAGVIGITLMDVKMAHLTPVVSLMYSGEANNIAKQDEKEVTAVLRMMGMGHLLSKLAKVPSVTTSASTLPPTDCEAAAADADLEISFSEREELRVGDNHAIDSAEANLAEAGPLDSQIDHLIRAAGEDGETTFASSQIDIGPVFAASSSDKLIKAELTNEGLDEEERVEVGLNTDPVVEADPPPSRKRKSSKSSQGPTTSKNGASKKQAAPVFTNAIGNAGNVSAGSFGKHLGKAHLAKRSNVDNSNLGHRCLENPLPVASACERYQHAELQNTVFVQGHQAVTSDPSPPHSSMAYKENMMTNELRKEKQWSILISPTRDSAGVEVETNNLDGHMEAEENDDMTTELMRDISELEDLSQGAAVQPARSFANTILAVDEGWQAATTCYSWHNYFEAEQTSPTVPGSAQRQFANPRPNNVTNVNPENSFPSLNDMEGIHRIKVECVLSSDEELEYTPREERHRHRSRVRDKQFPSPLPVRKRNRMRMRSGGRYL